MIKVILLSLCICTIIFISACSNDLGTKLPSSDLDDKRAIVENDTSGGINSPVPSSEDTGAENIFEPAMGEGEIRIRLMFSDRDIIAILEDNPTTQSLLAQLPVTVNFDDFAGVEKIAYLPVDLSPWARWNPDWKHSTIWILDLK